MANWSRALEFNHIQLQHDPAIDNDDELDPGEMEIVESHYRDQLFEELPTVVKLVEVEEDDERATEGGVWEPAVINILITVGALAGTYASLRVVADDVRSIIARLKARRKDGVRIDSTAAWLLALDYVVQPNMGHEVELEHIGRSGSFSDDGYLVPRGWLVGLRVDGDPKIVIVADDGTVLAVADGFEYPLPAASGLGD